MSSKLGVSLLSVANLLLMVLVVSVPNARAEEAWFRDCCKKAVEGSPFPTYCCDNCCFFKHDCSGTLECN